MPTTEKSPDDLEAKPAGAVEPVATDAAGPAVDDEEADLRALLSPLSKVKVVAPPDLAARVPALIERRSAGRFFGPRRLPQRLASRLPLEWVSMTMLALLALVYALLRLAPSLLSTH